MDWRTEVPRYRRARAQFMRGESPPVGSVRPEILSSWIRSQEEAETRLALVAERDPTSTAETAARLAPATALLHNFAAECAGTASALVLADQDGIIVDTWPGSESIARTMTELGIFCGTDASERAIGTNGIGTALAIDGPIMVVGPEHYGDGYSMVTCIGAPIFQGGETLGAVAIVCPVEDTNPLLLPLVLRVAADINTNMGADAGRPASDGMARMLARTGPDQRPDEARVQTASFEHLLGTSPLWRTTVAKARAAANAKGPILVTGESGIGKLTLLRAMFEDPLPRRIVRVCDAAALSGSDLNSWLQYFRRMYQTPDTELVLRHVDLLDSRSAAAIVHILADEEPAERSRVSATSRPVSTSIRRSVGPLLDRLALVDIEIPALRERSVDIAALALGIVERDHLDVRLTTSALRTMSGAEWSGNVRQLETTLHSLAFDLRGGQIDSDDLPVHLHPAGDSTLTELERVERGAMVASLRRHHGNKTEAAASLGIARSTLYRKMRAYGIVNTDETDS